MRDILIFINNIKFNVPKNLTILQSLEFIGYNIPHFCYNKSLSVAGNCRMCLVEVDGMSKPQLACSTIVTNNIKVFLNTSIVQKSRESILEFLLLNHPLDCPICDQGGECDLQDQSNFFGNIKSRKLSNKTGVSDKFINYFIKSIMTRCIHCTRCIRFTEQVSNDSYLTTLGRGSNLEVGTFNTGVIYESEFSANIIDLCPVGAFTTNIKNFNYRLWELSSVSIYNIFDVFGSLVTIKHKNNEIIKILPFKNYLFEYDWLLDTHRYSFDSYNLNKLKFPLVKAHNVYIQIGWDFVKRNFELLNITKGNALGIIGDHIDLKSILFFKYFVNCLGSSNIYLDSKNIINKNNNCYFELDEFNYIDNLLIINDNLRFDSSRLNLKLKKILEKRNLNIYYVGPPIDLMYNIKNLGWNFEILLNFFEGKSKLSKKFINKANSLILTDFIDLNYSNKFNLKILNKNFSNINSNYIGINNNYDISSSVINNKFIFLYNSFKINLSRFSNDKVKIFTGSQGGNNILNADILLPSKFNYEEDTVNILNNGTFMNFNKVFSTLNTRHSSVNIFNYLNLNLTTRLNKKKFNFKLSREFLLKNYLMTNNLSSSYFFKFYNNLENYYKNIFLENNYFFNSINLNKADYLFNIDSNSFKTLHLKNK